MSNCCPKCNLYQKNPRVDYCCRICRDTGGTTHGNSCQRISCQSDSQPSILLSCQIINQSSTVPTSQSSAVTVAQTITNCCSICNLYKKYSGMDYCCRTCRDTQGMAHGNGCQRILCQSTGQLTNQPSNKPSIQPINTNKNICRNLRNNQPLYNDKNTICFYEITDPYYELTNFYPASITIAGKKYPTTEHYFQSQKFLPVYPQLAEQIRLAKSARDAFNLAKTSTAQIRSDWHSDYKDKVMYDALMAKFSQHKNLAQLLISTKGKKLVEHTINDNYWGDAGDNTGQNKLGKLLEKIRRQISNQTGGNQYTVKYLKYKKKYLDFKNLLKHQ